MAADPQAGAVEIPAGQQPQHDPSKGEVVKFKGPDGKEYETTAGEIIEWRAGQMQRSDYIQKTQEVANLRKQYEAALANAAAVGTPNGASPPGAARFPTGFPQSTTPAPQIAMGAAAQGFMQGRQMWAGQEQPVGTPTSFPPAAPQYYPPPPQRSSQGDEEGDDMSDAAAQRIAGLEANLAYTSQQIAQMAGVMEQQAQRTNEFETLRHMEQTMPGFNAEVAQRELDSLDFVEQDRYEGMNRATQLRLIHAERIAPRMAPVQAQPQPQVPIQQEGNVGMHTPPDAHPAQPQTPPQQPAVGAPQALAPTATPPYAQMGGAQPPAAGGQFAFQPITGASGRQDVINTVLALDDVAKGQGGYPSSERPPRAGEV